jgi:conjugal transfer pilus assembly protein TraV
MQWVWGRLLGGGLVGAFLLGGCAVVNPYQSEFKCPPLDDGQCISVGEAYDEALGGEPPFFPRRECPEPAEPDPPCAPCPLWPDCEDEDCEPAAVPAAAPCAEEASPAPLLPPEEYQGALYRRLAGLVKEPRTPLVAPPELLRVWLLPYEGEGGELFMERHVYVMVEKPRWVLGTYLSRPGGE